MNNDIKIKNFRCSIHGEIKPIVEPKCPKCSLPNKPTTLREFTVTHDITPSEYAGVHYWIRKHYGSACKCEMKDCLGISKKYEWALKRGKKYERNINNFMQMCRRCHGKYDVTNQTRKLARLHNPKTSATHCHRGHEFSKENTYIIGGGRWRMCRTCSLENSRKRWLRLKK